MCFIHSLVKFKHLFVELGHFKGPFPFSEKLLLENHIALIQSNSIREFREQKLCEVMSSNMRSEVLGYIGFLKW